MTSASELPIVPGNFSVEFPEDETGDVSQDREWCYVTFNGKKRKIWFHEYHKIYSIPGLYEYIFHNILKCTSPQTVCTLLAQQLAEYTFTLSDLKVLDLGAGNGMMGECLAKLNIDSIVGLDIVKEGAQATERDRPNIYKCYHVADLTNLSQPLRKQLEQENFNCLTSVSALGFSHIQPRVFTEAYNLISSPGWIAFNIKETFLNEKDPTGFSRLIRRMLNDGLMQLRVKHRYCHRLSIRGTPLYYIVIVALKKENIPLSLLKDSII